MKMIRHAILPALVVSLLSAVACLAQAPEPAANLIGTVPPSSARPLTVTPVHPLPIKPPPAYIQTVQDLQNMQGALSASYALLNDIDASATATWNGGNGFVPVGTASAPFTGSLDGQGFKITGLVINGGTATDVGLFGVVDGGTVQNIQLVGVNITVTLISSSIITPLSVGALVGHLTDFATAANCKATGTITSSSEYSGGLVGLNGSGDAGSSPGSPEGYTAAYINNSAADVTMDTKSAIYTGGLVGLNLGTITNGSATGSVTSEWDLGSVGGLVGGNIIEPGQIYSGRIIQSQASGSVSGNGNGTYGPEVGGLVGLNEGLIIDSQASGAVSGTGALGGSGTAARSAVGGLVGVNFDKGSILQSFAVGPASGGSEVGGLVGTNVGIIQASLATGPVTNLTTGGYLGGLVGLNQVNGNIAASYATGNVSGKAGAAIGGLVGLDSAVNVDTFDVGNTASGTPTISQSFSTGVVQGPEASAYLGGLVGGYTEPGGTVTCCSYWDVQTSTLSGSSIGTGETTAKLTDGFLPTGFDPTLWTANPGLYPYLTWLGPAPLTSYVNPKYVVVGVTYAPPGPSSNTFVQYQNSSLVGTTQSLGSSFTSSSTTSSSLSGGFDIGGVAKGQISANFSQSNSQTTTSSSAVTTSIQVQTGEKTFGTGNYFAPVNHDYDVIWIWLNPAALFTVYGSATVTWNGYAFDETDQPGMDIVGIELGYLNGDFGAMPPQYQASTQRAWAANQIWPAGQGPALTTADLAQIASADPFSASTYGPGYIGGNPPQETLDHRFTTSQCNGANGFAYNQAAPSGSANVSTCTLTYTKTSTQAQGISTSYSQTFSVDASVSASFFATFSADLKTTSTLTWTTQSQTSTTNTAASTSSLSVQGPPCGNVLPSTVCVPQYDSGGNQPTQFNVYQDNMYGTFMFAPVNYYGAATTSPSAITTLSPASATATGTAFTLTVNGTGFLSGATVYWNGSALTTTFVSATRLTASVSASLIAIAGSASVTVNSGGTTSNAVTFTISPPPVAGPAITSVSPSSAPAGSPSVTITIAGSGFVSNSVAQWNGLSLGTAFVNSTTLTAQIAAGDLITQGTGQITVANSTGPVSNGLPFVIASPALQFLTVAPCRIMDTRAPTAGGTFPANSTFGSPYIAAGTTRTIPIPSSSCGVPANAKAYSLNFTVVPRTGKLGSLTVWPTGPAKPNVSTLTSPDGSVLADAAIVPAGTAGSVSAYATDDTDLVVDINGYFVPPAAGTLQFYPLAPCRVLDTRTPTAGGTFPASSTFGSPSLSGGTGRSFPVTSSACGVPASAAAYSLNVTVVPQGALGFVTAWPTGQTQPFVSTMNSYDGTVLANAAIVPAGNGGAVSFFASNTTDLVIDINGYFAPPGSGGLNFYTVAPCRLVDTRNANGTFAGPTPGADTTRNFPLPQASCGLPSPPAAEAYSLSMTVYPSGGLLSYLTTWPAGGTQPFVSTLNAYKGLAVANAALVPAGTGGAISVFVTNKTDLTVDTAGYFGP